jgi:S-DNA-T family DNA segregation ATPase FtsK/SpoIIIE
MSKRTKYIFDLSIGISFLAFSLFLFISLISYNELDNSLSTISSSTIVFNKMGSRGAFISDIFFQMFGLVSYFLVALFTLIGISYTINSGNDEQKDRYNIYFKIIMLVIFILSSCGCVNNLINNAADVTQSGGGIGFFLNSIMLYINVHFLRILYVICIIFSLNILIDFDYKKFYALNKNFLLLLFFVVEIIFKIIKKLLMLLIPKNIYNKIKILLINHKNSKNKAKQFIDNQNKKIELLEKYIKENKNTERMKKIKKEYKLDLFTQIEKKEKEDMSSSKDYKIPLSNILNNSANKINIQTKEELRTQAVDLTRVLDEYKIKGKIVSIKAGPIITLHEFEPAAGIKSSRIIGSADDIARNLKVKSTRISVISEKNVLGIELPNRIRNTIFLKDILDSDQYRNTNCALPIILGVNIAGEPVIIDLAKCPHLLIAGTTGSGKSVAINTMILSLLYKFTPEECKFIMIDPKILELSIYQNIPHLLTPVVSDPKKAVVSLKWVVNEMESRYKAMSNLGVRNIYGYNEKIREVINGGKSLKNNTIIGYDKKGDAIYESIDIEPKIMPFIVVVVDEMADLMLTAGKDVEMLIQRIAQMARAAGIHIIMSTQRPSTDVITGVIKANFPSRISFLVSSKIDSRVIIGEQGAEQLLGFGDMLYSANGGKITRAHGPFVSDGEVQSVIDFILKQGIKPNYVNSIQEENDESDGGGNIDISIVGDKANNDEELYKQAIEIIRRDKRISGSYLQRQMNIGYNKASKLIERMEKEGIITPAGSGNKRNLIE